MQLPDIEKELDRLNELYRTWAVPIDRAIQDRLAVNKAGANPLQDALKEVVNEVENLKKNHGPFDEIHHFFDQLCPIYLTMNEEDRISIRSAFSKRRGIQNALLGYVYRASEKLKASGDKQDLLCGLAAVSMENCAVDYRDVLLALAEICVVAEEAGLDPKPAFTQVASLSDHEKPTGGNTSVREMLAHFDEYAVLAERRSQEKARKTIVSRD